MPGAALGVSLGRVVAVVAELDDGSKQVGSGYLVGGRVVLTAEHCTRYKLDTEGSPRSLRVVRATDGKPADVVQVAASAALDVAVLQLAESAPWPAELTPPVYARVDRLHGGELSGCQAIGYPELQHEPQEDTWDHAEVHPTVYQTDHAESGRLLLREPLIHPGQVEEPPGAPYAGGPQGDALWGGLSGALVFYDGRAIGVIVEHHPRQGDSAFRAMAFDTIVRKASVDPGAAQIARTLGLPAEEAMPWAAPAPGTSRLRPPLPPASAVPRPGLAAATLSGLHAGPCPLVVLAGPGGFGKSILAMQVAAEVDAQAALGGDNVWCPGGVVWLQIGKDPDLAGLLSQRLTELTGTPSAAGQSAEKLADDLGLELAVRGCLLVLDDVWPASSPKADVASIVISRIGSVPRLVTTRSAELLGNRPGPAYVEVPVMEPDEAVAVLAGAVSGPLTPADAAQLGEFAERLGYWPLLLQLVGGYLQTRVSHGVPLGQALTELAQRYQDKGVTAFDAHNPVTRDAAVAQTMEASLGLLEPEDRARYQELAVFPPGQAVPFDVVAGWWAPALDQYQVEDMLALSLPGLGLLAWDWKDRTMRLHDVLADYLRPAGPDQRAALHRRLTQNWGSPLEQDSYRTRWYAYHLDLAGESEQLYALISLAWRDHVLAVTGALSDFEDDVLRAAAHAVAEGNLPQEVRCQLVAASVVEYAEAVPGILLTAYAYLGQADRAAGYATLNTTMQGSLAMTDVATMLARQDPAQALAVAGQAGSPLMRQRVLTNAATAMASMDISQALENADGLTDGWMRDQALAGIAATVARTDPDQALAIAGRIEPVDRKADALGDVAAALADADPGRALAITGQIEYAWMKDRALAKIVTALASHHRDQALAAARGIADPAARARALTDVAEALTRTSLGDSETNPGGGETRPGRSDADEAADEILTVCADIGDAAAHAQALARLGAVFPGRASDMAAQAIAAADGIGDAGERTRTLRAIVTVLSAAAPDAALTAADRIDDPETRAQSLATVAAVLADAGADRWRQLADQALALADTCEPVRRAYLQTGLAIGLARTHPDETLAIAGQLAGAPWNDRNLGDIVQALAWANPDQALAIARRVGDRWFKARAIATVATTLVDTDRGRFNELADEALAAAAEVEPPWYRACVLATFAEVLPGTDLGLALDVTDRMDDNPGLKDQTLGNIARKVAEWDSRVAETVAGWIGSPAAKATAVSGIAVAEAGRDADLALTTAAGVDAWIRADTLAGITQTLAKSDPRRAAAVAEEIVSPWPKAQALAWVAAAVAPTDPDYAARLTSQALERASHIDIDVPQDKMGALLGIAVTLAEVDPGSVTGLVDQTLAAADRIDGHDDKAAALCVIAQSLAETHPVRAAELITQALDASDDPRIRLGCAVALTRIAPGLRDPLVERILDSADRVVSQEQRDWMLDGLATVLAGYDVERAMATAGRIGSPSGQARAVAGVAAALSAHDPRRAFNLADEAAAAASRVDPGIRGQLLVDIAGTLAQQNPRLALVAVDRLEEPKDTARALAQVAQIRAERMVDSTPDRCDSGIVRALLTRLRGIAPAYTREAWWRTAQLAVLLADSAPQALSLIRAVLQAEQ